MIALNIESMSANEECFVIVECIHRETFKMIGESHSVKNNQEDYGNIKYLFLINWSIKQTIVIIITIIIIIIIIIMITVQALLRPAFMSGNVFAPNDLDTLLCQW